MKQYTQKFAYLLRRQHGNCAIAAEYDGAAAPDSIHHRLHDTKVNRQKYPLLIDSLWNLLAVNADWHMMHPSFGAIRTLEADRREAFLRRHPMIAEALNMEGRNGFFDESVIGDLPPYTNSLADTVDNGVHPHYLMRDKVRRKPAVEDQHKKTFTGSNEG